MKRRTLTKFKHVWIPTYGANVWWFCGSRKQYERLLQKFFKEEAPHKDSDVNGTCGVYYRNGVPIIVMWFKTKRIPVIAHECFHAVHKILNRAGVYLDNSSEEVYAYILQFLIEEVLQ